MHDIVKRDITAVLEKLIGILRIKEEIDVVQVKELSNNVIHNASVFQDEDSISIAVLAYSLSKIIERKQKELDYGKILKMLDSALSSLNSNQEESFRKSIKSIFSVIKEIDGKLKLYIQEVINQAQIKKGCKICEHGVSVARASEIIGVSQWELMHYLGKTMLIDQLEEPMSVSKRIKIARSLFS